jgi:hypothetical protein
MIADFFPPKRGVEFNLNPPKQGVESLSAAYYYDVCMVVCLPSSHSAAGVLAGL